MENKCKCCKEWNPACMCICHMTEEPDEEDIKPQPTILDQVMIDAYEGFIRNVYEACRFVEMGSGSKHKGVFEILIPIIKQHEKEVWTKISDQMAKD